MDLEQFMNLPPDRTRRPHDDDCTISLRVSKANLEALEQEVWLSDDVSTRLIYDLDTDTYALWFRCTPGVLPNTHDAGPLGLDERI